MLNKTEVERTLATLMGHMSDYGVINPLLSVDVNNLEGVILMPISTSESFDLWANEMLTPDADQFTLYIQTEMSGQLCKLVVNNDGTLNAFSTIGLDYEPINTYLFDASNPDHVNMSNAIGIPLTQSHMRLKSHIFKFITNRNRQQQR